MPAVKKDNMALWNSVSKTNPEHTKRIDQRGGFTAIDAHSQIEAATRVFGPAGAGWGWDVELQYPPNDTILAIVTLWHGKPEQTVKQVGQKKLNGNRGPDEDAVKKAVTDGITKCLSYLGFNADVFLGRFDDNKYVQQVAAEFKEAAKPKEIKDFEDFTNSTNDPKKLIKEYEEIHKPNLINLKDEWPTFVRTAKSEYDQKLTRLKEAA